MSLGSIHPTANKVIALNRSKEPHPMKAVLASLGIDARSVDLLGPMRESPIADNVRQWVRVSDIIVIMGIPMRVMGICPNADGYASMEVMGCPPLDFDIEAGVWERDLAMLSFRDLYELSKRVEIYVIQFSPEQEEQLASYLEQAQ
jgi:hypothetical protein